MSSCKLEEAIAAILAEGELTGTIISLMQNQDKPISTVVAFDLDIEGGVTPRPGMPRAGRLMVIGARTGVGKTALEYVGASLAADGLKVGFVSAELDSRAIEARIIANLSKSFLIITGAARMTTVLLQ